MGLMQHLRVAFDVRNGRLYASAGHSYDMLHAGPSQGPLRDDGA
jgi:hypothetical protein